MNKLDFIEKIIGKGEGKQLEFKELIDQIAIAKTVCSFLNNDGGQILIGVRDNKLVVGIANAEAEAKMLNDFLVSQIVPESSINIFVEEIDIKKVIVVEVVIGSKQPYVFQGTIYVRKGVKTVMANATDVTSLINKREEANLHWERQTTVGADISDLDLGEVRNTIREIDKTGKGNPSLSGDLIEFLEHYGLYKAGKITNACMLLFGNEPTKFIPQCRVRMTIFKQNKTSSEYSYDKLLEANIFKVVKQVEEFFEINLGSKSTFRSDNWKRHDKLRYPKHALREGVLNAIIHRDYKNSSGSVLIGIYPDKLEISNYGGLPPDWKPLDLKTNHLSLPRNPDIAHMFYMKGYIEKIGRGTLMIIDETTKMGFKEPTWTVKSSFTTLTFIGISSMISHKLKDGVNEGANDVVNDGVNEGVNEGVFEGVNEGVKEGLIRVVKVVLSNPGIVANDISKSIKKAKATTERYIKLLRTMGLIEFKGAPKTGGYFLSEKANNKISKK